MHTDIGKANLIQNAERTVVREYFLINLNAA